MYFALWDCYSCLRLSRLLGLLRQQSLADAGEAPGGGDIFVSAASLLLYYTALLGTIEASWGRTASWARAGHLCRQSPAREAIEEKN